MSFGFAHLEPLLQHTSLGPRLVPLLFFRSSLPRHLHNRLNRSSTEIFSFVDASAKFIGDPAVLRSCLGFALKTNLYHFESSVSIFCTPKPFGRAKFIKLLIHVQNAIDVIMLQWKIMFQSCHKRHGTQNMETYASTGGDPLYLADSWYTRRTRCCFCLTAKNLRARLSLHSKNAYARCGSKKFLGLSPQQRFSSWKQNRVTSNAPTPCAKNLKLREEFWVLIKAHEKIIRDLARHDVEAPSNAASWKQNRTAKHDLIW